MKNHGVKKSITITAYLVLVSVFLTIAFYSMPQIFSSLLANYVSFAPINDLVFSSHPVICQEAVEKIKKLSIVEKPQLGQYISDYLVKGPAEVSNRIEQNKLINMLADLISLDAYGDTPKNLVGEQCMFESLKALGPAAKVAAEILLNDDIVKQYRHSGSNIKEIIINVAKTDPETLGKIKQLITTSNDSISDNQNNLLWYYFSQSSPDSLSEIFDIYSNSLMGSKKFEMSLRFLSEKLYQKKVFPAEMIQYLSESKNPAQKRIHLLQALRNAGLTHLFESALLLQLAKDPLLEAEIRSILNNIVIKSQDDLNTYFELNGRSLKKIDLKKKADWAKLNQVVSFVMQLGSKIPKFASNNTSPKVFDFSKISNEVIKILKSIAASLGYQTESYKKLAAASVSSSFAYEMLPYFESLLKNKNEKKIAISYLLQIGSLARSTQLELANLIKHGAKKEKLELLTLINFRRLERFNEISEKTNQFEKQLLDEIFELLSSEDEEVLNLAFSVLINQGLDLVPYIKERTEGASAKKRLNLLRLNWQFSSTQNSYQELSDQLQKIQLCTYSFAAGFTELLQKPMDSAQPEALQKPQTEGASQGATVKENREYEHPIARYEHDKAIVQRVLNEPSVELFKKLLTCPEKYLNPAILSAILQYNKKFKSVLLEAAEKSTEPKSIF